MQTDSSLYKRIVTHSRYAVFQMTEVAVRRALFVRILQRIQGLSVPRSGRLAAALATGQLEMILAGHVFMC